MNKDTPPFEKFVTGIGSITVAWSQCEMILDHIVGILFHHFGGHPSEKLLPKTGADRKMRYAKKCFNNNSELEWVRADAIPYLDRMKFLAEERHWCVHGVVLDLTKGEPFEILRFKAVENVFNEDHKQFTLEDIAKLIFQIVIFSNAFANFVGHWIHSDPKIGRDAPSEAPLLHIVRRTLPTQRS
jgi:hypothetical protein